MNEAMSQIGTFELFGELPGELRNKIWRHTLEARRITLTCKSVSSRSSRAKLPRPFSYTPRPIAPDYPIEQFAWLTTEMKTPMALRVNHESRSFALQTYTTWRIWKVQGCFRPVLFKNLMWDPSVDIIDFHDMNYHSLQAERFLQLFIMQFPLQASQVQRLSVSSSLWESLDHNVVSRIWPLVECKKLKEFFIDIDHEYEIRVAKSLKSYPVELKTSRCWTLPQDVDKLIVVLKEHHLKWAPETLPEDWKPLARIAWDKMDGFMRAIEKDSEVVLRCFPCPELGVENDISALVPYRALD